MNYLDTIAGAKIDDIKRGYIEDDDTLTCLICGNKIEKGIIYQMNGVFYEAEKYMKLHIEKEHSSVFKALINLDKKVTGLSDHQNKLIRLFYEGKNDAQVQSELKIGSSSTIRNHRFLLREKERQAKIFLVLMELMKSKNSKMAKAVVEPHRNARMVDDRYDTTEDENAKLLKKYFPDGLNGPLKTFHMKEKSKIVVLRQLAKRFIEDRVYTEKEVNEILQAAYDDFVTLRRYLIEYGFMERKPDGSAYWVKTQARKENGSMDHKKELKMEYREMKTEGGVYQIRNLKNNKVLIISTPNFKTMNGKQMSLVRGTFFTNKELEKDIKVYGPDSFVFEILETLDEKDEPTFIKKDELKKLEEKWLQKVQPYGDKGYNKQG